MSVRWRSEAIEFLEPVFDDDDLRTVALDRVRDESDHQKPLTVPRDVIKLPVLIRVRIVALE